MAEAPLELSATDAARVLRDQSADVVLLDCRTLDEHAAASIRGALLIPMQELPERVAELEPHRTRPIIVHCHHGMRSLRVARWLRERGFALAQSMAGGIEAWSSDVDPGVPRY